VAVEGVLYYLLATGGLLAFCCLGLTLEVHGKLSSLSSDGFVRVFAAAALLVIAGAGLKAWTYTCECVLRKDELQARLKLLEATARVAEKSMQCSSEIARATVEGAKAHSYRRENSCADTFKLSGEITFASPVAERKTKQD
jgi:hypothetical protein